MQINEIKELQNQGVILWVEGNILRYKGPSQVITPDVLNLLINRSTK